MTAPAETIMVPVQIIPVPAPWFRNGTLGWGLIAAGILIWDLAGPETLSDAFRRVNSHPAGKVAVAGAWAILTLHLFGKMPQSVDPLHAVTVARGRLRQQELACCADPWAE